MQGSPASSDKTQKEQTAPQSNSIPQNLPSNLPPNLQPNFPQNMMPPFPNGQMQNPNQQFLQPGYPPQGFPPQMFPPQQLQNPFPPGFQPTQQGLMPPAFGTSQPPSMPPGFNQPSSMPPGFPNAQMAPQYGQNIPPGMKGMQGPPMNPQGMFIPPPMQHFQTVIPNPSNQYQKTLVPNNAQQKRITELEDEKQELVVQIENLEKEKKKLNQQLKSFQTNQSELSDQQQLTLDESTEKISSLNQKVKQLEKQLAAKQLEFDTEHREKKDLEEEKSKLIEKQKFSMDETRQFERTIIDLQKQLKDTQENFEKINTERNRYKEQLKKLEGNNQLKELLDQVETLQQDIYQLNSENVKVKEDYKILQWDCNQLRNENNTFKQELQQQQLNNLVIIKQSNEQQDELRLKIQQQEQENFSLKDEITIVQKNMENFMSMIDREKYKQQMQESLESMQNLINQTKSNSNSQQQQIQADFEKKKEMQRVMEQQKINRQFAVNSAGKDKIQEFIRRAGVIQCCYITDLQKNDNKSRNNIIKSVLRCCREIKKTTGRSSIWGAVCYSNPKGELMSLRQFNEDPGKIEEHLKTQKSISYEDKPEDLKAAIIQASTMDWREKYKLAIIISTSPCHGKVYHHPSKYRTWFFFNKKYDKKPEDNIENALVRLMEKEIVLLGIRFNDDTTVMYNQIEQIYKKHKKGHLFFTLSINKMDSSSAEQEIADQICKMAATLIGTNNNTTKTKTNGEVRQANFQDALIDMRDIKKEVVKITDEFQQEAQSKGQKMNSQEMPQISVDVAKQDEIQYEEEVKRNAECKDGALEALCKKGDFSLFEKKTKTVQNEFKVHRIELKEEIFEKKKEKIQRITYEDFSQIPENTWKCIRTENPFALGMMKKVYLMKKQEQQDQLFVVKVPIESGPYGSMQKAIEDCRSHLISKSLMTKFMRRLKEKQENVKYPEIIYTDFLILEELQNNTPNGKYWLAERFFKGDFKKYNNNDGYISEENTTLNKMAQAFSYYTYQESGYSYVVNDVQGVDRYFTDPAINTTEGKFDETDCGEEGIGNFLATLQIRGDLCKSLLQSIDIEMD